MTPTKSRKRGPLSRSELRSRIDRFPRSRLAALPTPLEEMPRLTAELGGPRILVKREDMTGLAFGGNKARHYEYELPHVRDEGYDAMINVMDYHSNNARMTGAAANKFGMRYVLVLKNAKGRPVQGNLLVDQVLGAEIHALDDEESHNAIEYARSLKEQMDAEGHKTYLLQDHLFPRIVGMVGFVGAGLELTGAAGGQGDRAGPHHRRGGSQPVRADVDFVKPWARLAIYRCDGQLRHAAGRVHIPALG